MRKYKVQCSPPDYSQQRDRSADLTFPQQKLKTKKQVNEAWSKERNTQLTSQHHKNIQPTVGEKNRLHWKAGLSRAMEVALTQLRLGHAFTKDLRIQRYGHSISASCSHCHSEPETIEHLLVKCPELEALRLPIFTFILKKTKIQRADDICGKTLLGEKDISLGINASTRIQIIELLSPLLSKIFQIY